MNQYECSVIIAQYNPNWEKLKRTLNSILEQKNCNYELLIADDGSKCNCFSEIKKYLEVKCFNKYKFVESTENQGTVKNIISGLRNSNGKYVRVIAPGDMLYGDMTLRRIVNFMEEHDLKESFGRMAFFEPTEKGIEILSMQVPARLAPYYKNDLKSIKKHLLVLGDNISGASYSWEKEYYLECLTRIEDKVIYLEDCVNIYTIYDGHSIGFMDEFVTWYEYGTGISTGKNKKWTQILLNDWNTFYSEIVRRYPKDKYIKKATIYYKMSLQGVLINKIIKNLICFERYIFGRFLAKQTQNVIAQKEYILKWFGL